MYKMKKLLFFIVALSIVIAGCKKSSYVAKFDKTPQERAGEQIALVSSILTSAPNGWVATLPTQAGGGYSFYLAFDNQQNVTMYGDLTDPSATVAGKSYYRVKQDIGTELVFDSYNYIAMLDDPNAAILGGASKIGYSSDVEFTYERSTADSIVFLGKKYRQAFKLVKATAAQKTAYLDNASYKTAIDKFKSFFVTTKNPYIDMGAGATAIKVGVSVNATNNLAAGKRTSFLGVLADGKSIGNSTSKFAFSLDGAGILDGGLVFNGVTFVRYTWKDATTLALYDSTGKEYIIKSSATPIVPLHLGLGVSYVNVVVPSATTYPGWGADFISQRALAATGVTTFSVGGSPLSLGSMTFTFNAAAETMNLNVITPYAATSLTLLYPFKYTKSASNVYKFNSTGPAGNAASLAGVMGPLLAQRINVDTFTVDYFVHPTTGALMAQFTSVEHPTFVFTGTI
jgi:hypothetical protein